MMTLLMRLTWLETMNLKDIINRKFFMTEVQSHMIIEQLKKKEVFSTRTI